CRDGRTFAADHVIVTAPLKILIDGDIQFTPKLPSEKSILYMPGRDWWNGFNNHNNDDRDPPEDSGLWVHYGGDYMVAAAYLSRGEGAVRDKDGQNYDDPPERALPNYHRYQPLEIEWYQMDEDLNGIDDIKMAVMEYGAVATCMNADPRLRDETHAHYQPPNDNREPNHAVAIVGWDDAKTTPAPLDGAWLIKNSWGSEWGNEGFFWISYYDRWACKHPEMGAVSFRDVSYLAFDRAYYHDYHGWRDTWYNSTEAFNSYVAERNEQLKGVSFYTTEDGVTAKVTIWDDFRDGSLENALWSDISLYRKKGLHTVFFEEPLELEEGNDFHIMLNVSRGGIAFDRTSLVPTLLGPPTREPGFDSWITSLSAPNQSFYRKASGWSDLYHVNESANFCIKGLVGHVNIASPMTHDKMGTNYTVKGSVSQEIDQVKVRIDEGEEMNTIIRNGLWEVELIDLDLTAGPHVLTATGTQDGCADIVSTTWVEFIFDDNDPVTRAELTGVRGDEGWFISEVGVELLGTDPTSEIAATMFRVDSGAWENYSQPFVIKDDAVHELSFRSLDIAGNLELPVTLEVKIDKGLPGSEVVLLGDMGSEDWYVSPVEMRFITSDDMSGVKCVELEIDGETMTYDENEPPVVSSSGSHEFRYRSRDIAGNIEEERIGQFRIDLETPRTDFIVRGMEGDNGYYLSPVEIELVPREGHSGLAGCYYRVVGGSWGDYISPILISKDGRFIIEYYSEDLSGHTEQVHNELIQVDTTPPETELLITSEEIRNNRHLSKITVNLHPADATSGTSSTYWSMDGGDVQRYRGPFVFERTGTHSIRYWSRDNAGNVEEARSAEFILDLNAPEVAMTESLDGKTINVTSFLITPWGYDWEGGSIRMDYSLDGGDWVGISEDCPSGSTTGAVTISGLAEGWHFLVIRGTDVAGWSSTRTYGFLVNLTAENIFTEPPPQEVGTDDEGSGPILMIILSASAAAILISGAAMTVYLTRRKRSGNDR
ncbi:MAG: OmpL47-type beta-barrel domain-containing protein, partial [Thermoplasmatota archaeon]